ncbi:MAG TPA: alpha-amylase family glycosyl hydrolase [bacterium]|nr:alpha-amylase family glycosyl hydrolase [bacterium]HPN44630.1 alpha-amylase family glycosyl hydrolase [bacterium]
MNGNKKAPLFALVLLLSCHSGQRIEWRPGQWLLQPDTLNTGIQERWFDTGYTPRDSVIIENLSADHLPSTWNDSGLVWYFNDFTIDDKHNIALAIPALHDSGTIWINGQLVGAQSGELTEQFDLSTFLNSGHNRMAIRVRYHNRPAGITGEVTMFRFFHKKELTKSKLALQQAPQPPDWAKNAIIYEVNVRQYTQEGTFNAFADHLSTLKEMGVNILWFMPIHPIGEKNRKGTLGSYYSISDYYGVNPEFGSLDDFKRLVQKIHDMGMYTIIDLVINHTAWDNPMITEHPEWYSQNHKNEILAPVDDWTDVADLNYDNPELRRYMTDMMTWWVKEIGIDGYRCDVAEMVPGDFWKAAIAEVEKVRPIFMLAEGEAPDLHVNGFHMTYASQMYRLFNAIARGEKKISEIDLYLQREQFQYPQGAMRMRFTSNHDQNSWDATAVTRLGEQGAKAFAVLTFTLPGNPLIYSGQEVGSTKKLDFFEKDLIDWRDSEFRSLYTTLADTYKKHPALYNGSMTRLKSKQSYAFSREKGQDRVLVLVNLTGKTCREKIEFKDLNGNFTELFKGTTLTLHNSAVDIEMQPWEYRVYIAERITR